jgi:hypothetical protein
MHPHTSPTSVHALLQSWVEQVNKAEAEYWKRSGGVRVGWSDEILGFDCGGQQWVLEVRQMRIRPCFIN